MSGSLNKVQLIGNLGKDPEIRMLQSGGRVATLTLATSENWKDKATGERREKTEWHRVVVFNDRLIGVIDTYLKKGAKLYIEGQLENPQMGRSRRQGPLRDRNRAASLCRRADDARCA